MMVNPIALQVVKHRVHHSDVLVLLGCMHGGLAFQILDEGHVDGDLLHVFFVRVGDREQSFYNVSVLRQLVQNRVSSRKDIVEE